MCVQILQVVRSLLWPPSSDSHTILVSSIVSCKFSPFCFCYSRQTAVVLKTLIVISMFDVFIVLVNELVRYFSKTCHRVYSQPQTQNPSHRTTWKISLG